MNVANWYEVLFKAKTPELSGSTVSKSKNLLQNNVEVFDYCIALWETVKGIFTIFKHLLDKTSNQE